ncbi:MAG: hypothetical protein ACKVU4_06090 [Phycisphaerales bacterium]
MPIDPAQRPTGPSGIIPAPTPFQFTRGEGVRLRAAIDRSLAFAERVNRSIAANANPMRFWGQEQVRLRRAIREALAFVEKVHAPPRSPSPRDLIPDKIKAKGRLIDLFA